VTARRAYPSDISDALARAKAGRDPQPTTAVIDTQSVKTSNNPPTTTQGTDAETRPASSEAMIHIAMIDNVSRRITDETTPTWRGTY
jgi:hypothetical protein